MADLHAVAGKAFLEPTAGTTTPATDGACEAARLFFHDVTHVVRWHAVAAGVALAATPLVYQLSRVAAQRCRAELVSAAKDAVQREELFNGAEADGVLIDPADEGGITISYGTLSRGRRHRQQQRSADGVDLNNNSGANIEDNDGSELRSASTASSTLAMRVGRRHSWIISSFAHQVLAAQRAPNVQFVRTCSRAAMWQYMIVVLRACTTSCVLCVAALSVTHACCAALDKLIPLTPSSSSSSGAGAAAGGEAVGVGSLLRDLVSAPLFHTTTPPAPSVACAYGLYDFSVSASGVWSRLIPKFGVLQTLYQRFVERLQPLHVEWRGGLGGASDPASSSTSSSSPHPSSLSPDARADRVWAALTPRGYVCVTLLSRLPRRVLDGLRWGHRKAADAVMRRWYDRTAAAIAAGTSPATPLPQTPRKFPEPQSCGSSGNTSANLKQRRKRIHSPLFIVFTLFASDVAFAGLVFVATSLVSGGSSGGPRPLVRNAAGARYNVYCWVEAVTSVLTLVMR